VRGQLSQQLGARNAQGPQRVPRHAERLLDALRLRHQFRVERAGHDESTLFRGSTSFPSETVYDLATYRACRKLCRYALDAADPLTRGHPRPESVRTDPARIV